MYSTWILLQNKNKTCDTFLYPGRLLYIYITTTLGFILYNNTFVVNSLLSDAYLIEVQYNANCGMFVI